MYFRIEMIEPLDERELLTQLLEHYCLVYAFKDATKNREALASLAVKWAILLFFLSTIDYFYFISMA